MWLTLNLNWLHVRFNLDEFEKRAGNNIFVYNCWLLILILKIIIHLLLF